MIGWLVPFSDERLDAPAHVFVPSGHPGLAYRLCKPGLLVNPALGLVDHSRRQCKVCRLAERRLRE